MTEQEAKKALFDLTLEYMSHKPKERKKLYSEYIENRNRVKEELTKMVLKRKEEEHLKTMQCFFF